ncbi:MAG: hypothetical protein HY306_09585 [Nitrosomonadales bacterium]|nr:hypothetical protein [Nitrosomonadales bacterium]
MNIFSSREPDNHKLPTSFGFERPLLQPAPLAQRLAECLALSIDFFDNHTTSDAVSSLARLMRLADAHREALLAAIVSIGHIGLLLPAATDEKTLAAIAADMDLMITGSAPSEIFARELGMLAGGQTIATRIYRMAGVGRMGRPANIEAFVPEAETALVDTWIQDGVGTHLAFRVQSRLSVWKILELLADCGYSVPPFMHGKAMENHNKGSLIIYYDLPDATGKRFRVEFYHEP